MRRLALFKWRNPPVRKISKEDNMGPVYTTGRVAKICGVCDRTVARWVDTGMLKGFTLPMSKARRIPHDRLVEFMDEHGLPKGELQK